MRSQLVRADPVNLYPVSFVSGGSQRHALLLLSQTGAVGVAADRFTWAGGLGELGPVRDAPVALRVSIKISQVCARRLHVPATSMRLSVAGKDCAVQFTGGFGSWRASDDLADWVPMGVLPWFLGAADVAWRNRDLTGRASGARAMWRELLTGRVDPASLPLLRPDRAARLLARVENRS